MARSEYNLPVLSHVIYLLKDGNVPTSPLSWTVPTGQEILHFHYESVELGDLTPEELLEVSQPGLLPLLPLTRGGATRHVADTMFSGLQATGRTELITIGGTLASYVFSRENAADLGWLQRRLHEMHDILRESPYYQEILAEGREEGLEKGREQGQLEALRQTVIDIVLERFPKMIRLTRKQVAFVEDPAILRHLIVKMSISQTMEEAKQQLLKVDEEDEG